MSLWVDADTVRFYVRNIEPQPESVVELAIRQVQPLVASRLQRLYPMLAQTPQSPASVPPAVAAIVARLAASLLEARTLAITDVGGSQNPYAVSLYQSAMSELELLERGVTILPLSDASGMLPVFREGTPAHVPPVRQLRRTGAMGG